MARAAISKGALKKLGRTASDLGHGKVVSGDAEIKRKLEQLKTTAAKRAVQMGLVKAAQYSAKAVKASVPSKYKDVRKAIGWRAMNRSQNKNEPGAKVGAAVGKRGKKYYATTSRNRGGRPGVGFGEQNVHWWFLGTKRRTTGTTRSSHKRGRSSRRFTGGKVRNTGVFPPQDKPIAETLRLRQNDITRIIRIWTDVGIAKEVAKMKK